MNNKPLLKNYDKIKNDVLTKYYSSDILKSEWILIGIIAVFMLLAFVYMDLQSLTVWSVNFWDVLFDGHLWQFYQYTAQNLNGLQHQYMGCDILAILPLSIWNLPIWIIQHFFKITIASSPYLLTWSKLGLTFYLAAIGFMAYKICNIITDNHHQSLWAAVLTISSSPALISVEIAGQNDVFLVLLGLLSVYFLMRKRMYLCILFAALSIAIKPFFLLAFIPIVLLVDKNILSAALKVIVSFGIMLLSHRISSTMPLYAESINQGPTLMVLSNLFCYGVTTSGVGQASFLLMALAVISAVAYLTNPVDEQERNRFILFIAAAVFLSINSFSNTEFYRGILFAPYAAILAMSNSSKKRLNLGILFLFQTFYTVGLGFTNPYVYAATYVANSIFGRIFTYPERQHLYAHNIDFFHSMDAYMQNFLYTTISAASLMVTLLLLVLNYPRLKWKSDMEKQGTFAKYDHGLLCLNILSIIPAIIFTLMIYYS